MSNQGLAAFISRDPAVLEAWDAFNQECKAWRRRLRRYVRQMTEAQGVEWVARPKKNEEDATRANFYSQGGANYDRWVVLGVARLVVPKDPEEPPTWRKTKSAPIPPGWRMLQQDVCLTPIPVKGKSVNGFGPKSPEAVAARELLVQAQPPRSFLARLHELCGAPTFFFSGLRICDGAGMEEITDDKGRAFLLSWPADPEEWEGGGMFTRIKPSEYFALRGE
jgi:hypothetical protein